MSPLSESPPSQEEELVPDVSESSRPYRTEEMAVAVAAAERPQRSAAAPAAAAERPPLFETAAAAARARVAEAAALFEAVGDGRLAAVTALLAEATRLVREALPEGG